MMKQKREWRAYKPVKLVPNSPPGPGKLPLLLPWKPLAKPLLTAPGLDWRLFPVPLLPPLVNELFPLAKLLPSAFWPLLPPSCGCWNPEKPEASDELWPPDSPRAAPCRLFPAAAAAATAAVAALMLEGLLLVVADMDVLETPTMTRTETSTYTSDKDSSIGYCNNKMWTWSHVT